MKSGRRVANPQHKQLQGTYRKDRHSDIAVTADPMPNTPVRPAYMSEEGKLVWNEEVTRVIACGATEADSSLFARYCEIEATFRMTVMSGEPPVASLLTELRRMGELLGIGGLRSRLAKTGTAAPATASPFTTRKR
ncbi:hypothetical protein [uncultured Sphingomonas sp.]|uniref:hypothetical protein n=1 Tax=uncultured Sphingomonas sp. TaxID=158754 RepID=UPI0025E34403|nr:hypothetical protein [uncultured Sphingomonas sp.]